MTSLTSLSDAELNEKAAKAMGWTQILGDVGKTPEGENAVIPDPANDMDDAVRLAEWWRNSGDPGFSWDVESPWSAKPFWESTCCRTNVGGSTMLSNIEDASSPARALTLAVLAALEQTYE